MDVSLQGDAEGFSCLCTRYYSALVAIAHSILRDRHLAEDAAQEALAAACRGLRGLKDRRRFASWVASICRNQARDMLRSRRETARLGDYDPPAPADERDERLELVRVGIEALNDKARELVYLRYYDEMSYARMSAVLGLSEQAINGRLRRIRVAIRDHVAWLAGSGGGHDR